MIDGCDVDTRLNFVNIQGYQDANIRLLHKAFACFTNMTFLNLKSNICRNELKFTIFSRLQKKLKYFLIQELW
jgi:hypothetical protein